MAFTSRRLLPQTLTSSSSSSSSSFSSSPSPSPSSSPSPSPSPSDANAHACLVPFDPSCPSDSNYPWTYYSPPPPPPSFLSPPYNPSPSGSLHLSTTGIIAITLVPTLFLLTVYLILLARSRRNRPNNRGPHQGPPPPPGGGGQGGEEEEWNQNQAMVHPIWLINTMGLQLAVIGSIAVCEYKKGEGLIEGDYCSICLSEFEEGENLRLLPKCSHAFHISCIDTWLRSHTNCPLCRAPILSPVPASGSIAVLEPAGSGSSSGEDVGENTEGGDTADSSGVAEGGNGDEGLNDKSGAEAVEVEASVGRRSVSMDGNVTILVNIDGEGNRRGRVGGLRSLPGSGRFCRLGSDS